MAHLIAHFNAAVDMVTGLPVIVLEFPPEATNEIILAETRKVLIDVVGPWDEVEPGGRVIFEKGRYSATFTTRRNFDRSLDLTLAFDSMPPATCGLMMLLAGPVKKAAAN